MKCLVVGNGAREFAIARRLTHEGCIVSSLRTAQNAGLELIVHSSSMCDSFASDRVIQAALSESADLIVVGTEHSIFSGIADLANDYGIPIVAPSISASRLESDKAFAREIVESIAQNMSIPSTIVRSTNDCFEFMRNHGPLVVAKTLDVRLRNNVEILTSSVDIPHRLEQLLLQHGVFQLEKYIDGVDFSLYCVSDGSRHFFLRSVQDFPFKYPGNKGPKTGGMGSVSTDGAPNGISEEEILCAENCVEAALKAYSYKNGEYKGFLIAQFLKTLDGIYFNEFDVHPGDSEIINVIESLNCHLGDILWGIANGFTTQPMLNKRHVVCVCLASFDYPNDMAPTEFSFDLSLVHDPRVFFGLTERIGRTKLRTGQGRTLALSVAGNDPSVVKRELREVITDLDLPLYHREDILY